MIKLADVKFTEHKYFELHQFECDGVYILKLS